MLTKYIIEFFIYIIGQLLSIINSVIPGFDYLSNLTQAFNTLFRCYYSSTELCLLYSW